MIKPVAGLHQAKTCLFVQCRIIAEPDHHRTRVCIEIEFVVTMKERLEHSSGHDRFACASHCGQREGAFVGIAVPVFLGLLEIGQDIVHSVGLIVP